MRVNEKKKVVVNKSYTSVVRLPIEEFVDKQLFKLCL